MPSARVISPRVRARSRNIEKERERRLAGERLAHEALHILELAISGTDSAADAVAERERKTARLEGMAQRRRELVAAQEDRYRAMVERTMARHEAEREVEKARERSVVESRRRTEAERKARVAAARFVDASSSGEAEVGAMEHAAHRAPRGGAITKPADAVDDDDDGRPQRQHRRALAAAAVAPSSHPARKSSHNRSCSALPSLVPHGAEESGGGGGASVTTSTLLSRLSTREVTGLTHHLRRVHSEHALTEQTLQRPCVPPRLHPARMHA